MRSYVPLFTVTLGLTLAAAQACAPAVPVTAEEPDAAGVPPQDAAGGADAVADDGQIDAAAIFAAPTDSAVADTAVRDAADGATAVDAGLTPRDGELFDPLAPKTGDPCPAGVPENSTVSRRCGKCGNQLALCETGRIVGTYGPCNGEKTGAAACLPRERLLADCGFCGKQAKDCDLSCAYVEGACQGEVTGGCVANEILYVEGVCAVPGEVRRQVCSPTCTRGVPEPCAPRPLNEIVVSQVAGMTVSGEFPLITNKIAKLTTGACPRTLSTTLTNYQYVRVRNDGADSVNVTITNVAPSGTTTKPDTLATLYPGPNAPVDRTQCMGTVNDSPETFTVNIAAGASVVFHQNMYSATATNTVLKTDVKTNFVGAEVAAAPDYIVALGPTLGDVVTETIAFDAAFTTQRTNTGTCPVTLSSSVTAYRYVRITNADVVPRLVDISGDEPTDIVLAVYPGPDAPLNSDRSACIGLVNDTCSTAGFVNTDSCLSNVSVPAGGSVVAFVAHYYTARTDSTLLRVTTKN